MTMLYQFTCQNIIRARFLLEAMLRWGRPEHCQHLLIIISKNKAKQSHSCPMVQITFDWRRVSRACSWRVANARRSTRAWSSGPRHPPTWQKPPTSRKASAGPAGTCDCSAKIFHLCRLTAFNRSEAQLHGGQYRSLPASLDLSRNELGKHSSHSQLGKPFSLIVHGRGYLWAKVNPEPVFIFRKECFRFLIIAGVGHVAAPIVIPGPCSQVHSSPMQSRSVY